jgi:hypothetical protein
VEYIKLKNIDGTIFKMLRMFNTYYFIIHEVHMDGTANYNICYRKIGGEVN